MTDQTNDPVAAAAAQLEQQAAQPSSTEPSAPVVAQPDPTLAAPVPEKQPDSSSSELAPDSVAGSKDDAKTDAPGDDPNAAASFAESPSVGDTASSAPPASPVVATPVHSDSGVRDRAMSSIGSLRAHFWTFEQSAVAHLHKELDFLEHLFK